MRRLATPLVVVCWILPAAAEAASSPRLWATVNVCDTAAAPDTIGVRASMPGNGTRERMYMRFEAQRWSIAEQRFVATGASSRFLYVGRALIRSAQRGFSFTFAAPEPGTEVVLRGRVTYEWRARRRRKGSKRVRTVVVRRERKVTRAGVMGVVGADPPGFSEALCVLRP